MKTAKSIPWSSIEDTIKKIFFSNHFICNPITETELKISLHPQNGISLHDLETTIDGCIYFDLKRNMLSFLPQQETTVFEEIKKIFAAPQFLFTGEYITTDNDVFLDTITDLYNLYESEGMEVLIKNTPHLEMYKIINSPDRLEMNRVIISYVKKFILEYLVRHTTIKTELILLGKRLNKNSF